MTPQIYSPLEEGEPNTGVGLETGGTKIYITRLGDKEHGIWSPENEKCRTCKLCTTAWILSHLHLPQTKEANGFVFWSPAVCIVMGWISNALKKGIETGHVGRQV